MLLAFYSDEEFSKQIHNNYRIFNLQQPTEHEGTVTFIVPLENKSKVSNVMSCRFKTRIQVSCIYFSSFILCKPYSSVWQI